MPTTCSMAATIADLATEVWAAKAKGTWAAACRYSLGSRGRLLQVASAFLHQLLDGMRGGSYNSLPPLGRVAHSQVS